MTVRLGCAWSVVESTILTRAQVLVVYILTQNEFPQPTREVLGWPSAGEAWAARRPRTSRMVFHLGSWRCLARAPSASNPSHHVVGKLKMPLNWPRQSLALGVTVQSHFECFCRSRNHVTLPASPLCQNNIVGPKTPGESFCRLKNIPSPRKAHLMWSLTVF